MFLTIKPYLLLKLRAHAKLNFFKLNCFDIETLLTLN